MDLFGGVILSGDNVKAARCSRAEECALIGPPMVVLVSVLTVVRSREVDSPKRR